MTVATQTGFSRVSVCVAQPPGLRARNVYMPIRVWVDRQRRLRRSTASGVVTDRDFIDAYGEMALDSLCDPTLDHLADFRGVERLEVTTAGLQSTARIMARRIDPGLMWAEMRSKVAMVAPCDVVYGMLRIYQSYREADNSRVAFCICRTMEEARSWLGLEEEPTVG